MTVARTWVDVHALPTCDRVHSHHYHIVNTRPIITEAPWTHQGERFQSPDGEHDNQQPVILAPEPPHCVQR
jgi:hypothetical protein